MTQHEQYRLLTRSDFDGLVCGALLKELGLLKDVRFAHPKDVQDGKVEVTDRDIIANLPYVAGCHRCFDHHASEAIRNEGLQPEDYVLDVSAESAARVIYNYYGGRERFPEIPEELLEAVDKADAARFSRDEVLNPQGWNLLSFIMDARTGLGRFRNFRLSNYQLMMTLIDQCKQPVEQILAMPDVRERVEIYCEHEGRSIEQLMRCSVVHENLVVLDLREEDPIYATNRFMIYAIYPQCNVSMHVLWGFRGQNTVFTIGKSIFDRTSSLHIGELCLEYGGGGHANAGTCQVPNQDAERVRDELIQRIHAEAHAGAAV